eukprot:3649080-Alexandrium_andersonii.AAC.1
MCAIRDARARRWWQLRAANFVSTLFLIILSMHDARCHRLAGPNLLRPVPAHTSMGRLDGQESERA